MIALKAGHFAVSAFRVSSVIALRVNTKVRFKSFK